MGIQYSQEEYDLAKTVNCRDFLASRGYEMTQHGKNYKLKEHNSLVLFADGGFKWYSKEGVSGNAITLLNALENMPINEAVKELANYSGGVVTNTVNSSKKVSTKPKEYIGTTEPSTFDKAKNEIFILPEKNSSTKRIVDYLTNERHLSKDVVDFAIKENLVYQDKQGNCIFVGYDENKEPKFATLRGTYEKVYRKDILNSVKACGFSSVNKESSTLYVFESAIDSLSMMSINNSTKDNYLSLNGVSLSALDNFLEHNQNIKTIITCLDNDSAGRDATRKIWNSYGQDHTMKFYNFLAKDINEQLKLNLQEPKVIIIDSNIDSINVGQVMTFAETEEQVPKFPSDCFVTIKIVQGDFVLSEGINIIGANNEDMNFRNIVKHTVEKNIQGIKTMLSQVNEMPIDDKEKKEVREELNFNKNQTLQLSFAFSKYEAEKQKVNENTKDVVKGGDMRTEIKVPKSPTKQLER